MAEKKLSLERKEYRQEFSQSSTIINAYIQDTMDIVRY